MRNFLWNASLFGLGVVAGCQQLEPIPLNMCGNGVIEPPNESCDRGDRKTEDAYVCRPPGQPAECRIVCTADAEGKRNPCPAGWGCGVDDICRQPGVGFTTLGQPFGAAADQIRIADFNGDKRNDVLTVNQSALRAHYFTGSGALQSTFDLSIDKALPAVGQLTSDALADIAVGRPTGVSVLLGRSDGTFSPTVYASRSLSKFGARVLGIEVLPEEQGQEPLAFIGQPNSSTDLVLVDLSKPNAVQTLYNLPHLVGDLGDEISVGQLDERAGSPCDEIVAAFKNTSEVLILTPCRAKGENAAGVEPNLERASSQYIPAKSITLAGGAKVAGPTLLVQANKDDTHLDLIIAVQNPNASPDAPAVVAQIAYGVGDGTFDSDRNHSNMPGNNLAAWPDDKQNIPFPLAIGYLNDDEEPDYVWGNGVYVAKVPTNANGSGGSGGVGGGSGGVGGGSGGVGGGSGGDSTSTYQDKFIRRAAPSGADWTHARIGDFNGNGTLDVIATSETGLGVDFLNGVGDGKFAHYTLPTDGPVAHIASGDFDGDVVPDLAIVEVATPDDALRVLFGRRDGAPESPFTMGRLGKIQQIVSANLYDPGSQLLDGTAEIGMVTEGGGESSLAILAGSTDRLLQSPFGLIRSPASGPDITGAPIQCVMGNFASDADNHRDIAVLAREGKCPNCMEGPEPTYYLWLVKSTGEALLDAASTTHSDMLPGDLLYDESIVVPVDLDNDGVDEVVIFSFARVELDPGEPLPTDANLGSVSIFKASAEAPFTWQSSASGATKQGFVNSTFGSALDAGNGLPPRRVASVAVADIDLDGYLDVAVLGTVAVTEGANVVTRDRVVVFWNRGDGELDLETPLELPDIIESMDTEEVQYPVNGFAVLDTDAEATDAAAALPHAEREIAIATDGGVYSVSIARHDGSVVVSEPTLIPGVPTEPAKVIAAADMNGDGLDDLVVGNGSILRIVVRNQKAQ